MRCTLKEFIAEYMETRLRAYKMLGHVGCDKQVKAKDARKVWSMYMGIMAQGDDWHNV